MPGNRYLLDTNALVALLQGHAGLLALTERAEWLGVSVINVLEFLGFEGLLAEDRELFNIFVSRVFVVDVTFSDTALMSQIGQLRKSRAIKLPDAIIAASAVLHQATLVTNDAQLQKLAADSQNLIIEPF